MKQRKKQAAERGAPRNLSYLESVTVSAASLRDYSRRLGYFIEWARGAGKRWASYPELDETLCEYFDERFFAGWTSDEGAKVLASLAYHDPQLHKAVNLMLPRASRALRGWTKVGPADQRLPFPWCLLVLVIEDFVRRKLPAHAICLVIQWSAYLRPGEATSLKVMQLVAPVRGAAPPYDQWAVNIAPFELEKPAKTGLWDESVTLDNLTWAHPVLSTLVEGRSPEEALWPFDLTELSKEFQCSVERWQLAHLRPTLYAVRHSGASEDFLRRKRSLEEIQRRGRWRTSMSVRRYTKEAKLLSELHKVSPKVLEYSAFVESQIARLFTEPRAVATFAEWSHV